MRKAVQAATARIAARKAAEAEFGDRLKTTFIESVPEGADTERVLRDLVSHQYFSLELPRLRPAVVDELPALLAAVEGELGGETRQA